jgi:hypothetical protein
MYTQEQLDDIWSNISLTSTFEPTLNPFKNGLVVNYKKVGTRFLGELLSLPVSISQNKIQMDLIISKHPRQSNLVSFDDSKYQLNYGYERKFCYTEFDEIYPPDPPRHSQTYLEYSNSDEFLNYCQVENYNELFFNNKKDIIFLVRNPIHRFYSGLIQVLYTIVYELPFNQKLKKEINFYTGLTQSDLENVSNNIINMDINEKALLSFKKNEIELLILFLMEKQWNLLFQDIHTNNYLFNYVEWIHHIKDKTKIKIIDLKDCLSNKSLNFFTNLMGNDLLKTQVPEESNPMTYWEWMSNQTGTNKIVYKLFIDKLLQLNSNFLENSSLEYYLRSEYDIYDSLINSPYYVNLKD